MTETLTRMSAALADRYRIERELGQGGTGTADPTADIVTRSNTP
jgi:hypothetical protein